MYEEYCLPTNCDNVVSCKDSIPVLSTMCASAPSSELHKPEYPYCLSSGVQQIDCGVLLFTNCGVLWSKNKLWECCYVKFIALLSFMCQFIND